MLIWLSLSCRIAATALATAPTATTKPAAGITSTSAILEGTINANDKEATWHFDYATDADFQASGTYTNSTPGGDAALCFVVCVPILEHEIGVSETISNLTPNTTYHFRDVASNADGTTDGQDVTFTTASG